MSKRLVKSSLVAGLTLLLALPALASSQQQGARGPRIGAAGQGPARGGRTELRVGRTGWGGGGLARRVLAQADAIGLSAEQRDAILAARRSHQEAAINRSAAEQVGALELRDLMGAETRDVTAIEAKLRELAGQRITGTIAALRLDEQVGGLLSTEQLETLRATAPERRGRRGARDAGPEQRPRRGPRDRQNAR